MGHGYLGTPGFIQHSFCKLRTIVQLEQLKPDAEFTRLISRNPLG